MTLQFSVVISRQVILIELRVIPTVFTSFPDHLNKVNVLSSLQVIVLLVVNCVNIKWKLIGMMSIQIILITGLTWQLNLGFRVNIPFRFF